MGTVGVVPGTVVLGIESLPGMDVGVPGTVVAPGVVGTLRLPGLALEPSVPEPVELVLVLGTVVVSGVVFAGIVSPAGAVAPGSVFVASEVPAAGFFMLFGVAFLPFLVFFATAMEIFVDTVET